MVNNEEHNMPSEGEGEHSTFENERKCGDLKSYHNQLEDSHGRRQIGCSNTDL